MLGENRNGYQPEYWSNLEDQVEKESGKRKNSRSFFMPPMGVFPI